MKKFIIFCLIAMVTLLGSALAVSADTVLDSLDSFETLTPGVVSAADVTNHAKAFGSWFYPEGSTLEITEDGYNGGNAFTITENDTVKFQFALFNDTTPFVATADSPVYVSFKVMIKENIDNTAIFQINSGYDSLCNIMPSGSDYVFSPTNKNANLICNPGEWYDVLVKFSPNRADITITDKNGTSVTGYRANNAGFLYMYSSGGSSSPSKPGQSIAFDEIRILQGADASSEPTVKTAKGIFDPDEKVSQVPCFSLCYEPFMKINENDLVFSISDGEGNPVSDSMYELSAAFETVNISFIGMLSKKTQYTATLSGVKDMEGADVEPYSFVFTTESSHRLTLAEDGIMVTEGENPSVELTFDGTSDYPETNVKVMSAIYEDGVMTYLNYRTDVIYSDGKIILSSYDLPEGKRISDMTILIFSDSQKLTPICKAIKCSE